MPKDLPEQLVVDVTHLEIGQAIHIGDLKADAGVEVLGDKHISVIAVAAPISEAAEAAATEAGAAAGEVEMIKEKKEDGARRCSCRATRRPATRPLLPQPRRVAKKPPTRARRKRPRRRSDFKRGFVPPRDPPRPWRIYISSWAWEIPGPNTPERGTTSVFN